MSAEGSRTAQRDPARLFIDDAWREGEAGRADVVNPATEALEGAVCLASGGQLDSALAAADGA